MHHTVKATLPKTLDDQISCLPIIINISLNIVVPNTPNHVLEYMPPSLPSRNEINTIKKQTVTWNTYPLLFILIID
jgi:hypothetical protein